MLCLAQGVSVAGIYMLSEEYMVHTRMTQHPEDHNRI